MSPYEVCAEVIMERGRQDSRFGEQNHSNGTGVHIAQAIEADAARDRCDLAFKEGKGQWVNILEEEVAEALAESDPKKLRAELIQVAAVAVNWIEAIDRRTTKP